MPQHVKCLLHKHEDLSLDPKDPLKKVSVDGTARAVMPALERERHGLPRAHC